MKRLKVKREKIKSEKEKENTKQTVHLEVPQENWRENIYKGVE